MPPISFAITALNALSQLPAIIAAGVDVVNMIKSTNAVLKNAQLTGADITNEEWDKLDQMIEDLRNQRPTV